ncbi:MAG: UvrD-helicase domain-containing protein [Thermogutta sp.]
MKDSQGSGLPRHLLIRASAGSGKTFQLIHGLARLLLAGRPVESILATTFSRKAAREILDGLLTRLRKVAEQPERARDLAQIVGTTVGPGDCLALLRDLVDRLDRINICTLDSFFVRVAQRFRLELDLPWTWTILDEEADRRLRLRAISEMLADEKKSEAADWMRLLTKGLAVRSVTEQLLELVYQLYDLVFLESEEAAWSALPAAKELSENELHDCLEALDALPSRYENRRGVKIDKRVTKALVADAERARAADWEKFLTTGIARAVANGTDTYYGKPIDADLLDAYRPAVAHAQAVLRNRIRRQTAAVFRMLREFHGCYEAWKRRQGGLTFADVTRRVRDGLADSWRTSPLPAYRLDGTVEHLLLDEFQDTSMSQWEALRPLVDRIRTGNEGTLFCVGDVKQSIYGWRGSEPAIIENLPDEIPEIETRPLDCSYRSSPVIIETVNRVFGGLSDNAAFADRAEFGERGVAWEAACAFAAAFQPHDTTKRDLDGYCVLMSKEAAKTGRPSSEDADQTDNGEPEETSPESSRAVQLIARLHHEYPDLEIGVLFRKKDAIPPLLAGLRRLGIPVSEEAGNPLDLAPGVRVLLSLLRLADHPGDTAAAFHVAHSPLADAVGWRTYAGRSAAEQAAARRELSLRLRTQIGLRGFGSVISDYAQILLPFTAVEDVPRLERLAVLAYAYEPRGRFRVDDFVRWVESRREAEPSQGLVRLMTIHASKGLQFPIVVLPDLDQRLEGQTPKLAADRGDPRGKYDWVCPWIPRELREVGVLPKGHAERFDGVRFRVIRESLCLLYVAMTRAIHALYMLINPSKNSEKNLPTTWAGILRAALVPPEDDRDPTKLRRIPSDAVLWSSGNPNWRPPHSPPTQPPLPVAAEQPIRFTRDPRTPRAARWLSPHALEGRDRPIREVFRRPSRQAMDEGSVLHLWFSQIEWWEDGVPDERVLYDLAAGACASNPELTQNLPRLAADFRRLLEGRELRALLSRHTPDAFLPRRIVETCPALDGADWVVWRERPFAVFLEDGTFCRGQFDRVAAAYRDGRPILAQVIDYKTDKVRDAASALGEPETRSSLIARAAFYRPQLEQYREAAACLLGLPRDRLAAALAFVYAGKVVTLDEADVFRR